MDNYFFKENIVVQVYDFFKKNNFQSSNPVTIYNFLEGKEGFIIKDEKGLVRMDVGMVKYISKICSKMENDGLIAAVRDEDRRKIYRITEEGRAVLRAEGERLLGLAKIAAKI